MNSGIWIPLDIFLDAVKDDKKINTDMSILVQHRLQPGVVDGEADIY